MSNRFIGLDLGTHCVKGVVVNAGFRGMQVVETFEEPVDYQPKTTDEEHDPSPAGAAVHSAIEVLRRRKLTGEPLGLCVPAGMLSYRVLGFPFRDLKRIAQMVHLEAEGQFPLPLDELVLAHTPVQLPGEQGHALVTAAPRDRVEQLLGIFRRVGCDVRTLTSPATAIGQVAQVYRGNPAPTDSMMHGALVLDLGHHFGHCVAIGPKGPLAVRLLRRSGLQLTSAIARAYHMQWRTAEETKHAHGFVPNDSMTSLTPEQRKLGEVVLHALAPIVREIVHTRLWLRSTYKLDIDTIWLSGGTANLRGLAEHLAQQTGLSVQPLELASSIMKMPAGFDTLRYAAAAGAAYASARRPLIELRSATGETADHGFLQAQVGTLATLGLALVAALTLDAVSAVRGAELKLNAYRDELNVASERAFGEGLTPAEVDARLNSVQGEDLSKTVPGRGALEVLALVAQAATPTDANAAPPNDDATPPAATDEGKDATATSPSEGTSVNQGVVVADELSL